MKNLKMSIGFSLWRWVLARIKTILFWIPFMNKSFVILSSGRSGSTLLVQLLNCHPSIQCRGELLNREDIQKRKLVGAKDDHLINYILAQLLPLKIWLAFTGFKIFNEQLEYCKLSFAKLLTALRNPPVIVSYRENFLETFVSLKIAFQTDIWYSEKRANEYAIEVDWEEFKNYMNVERARCAKTVSLISPKCKHLFISFEELEADQTVVIERIFSFLNLEFCPTSAVSIRQNPLPLHEKITNYKDIMEKIKECNSCIHLTSDWLDKCQ